MASSGGETPQHHFREVLDNIEKHRLLSPLLVVSTLSSCPTATLGVVRDYLLRTLQSEEVAMNEDKKMIEQYKENTSTIRAKIEELNTSVTIFQATKCSACNQPLELPTVHFLCQHGYHQHCFQSFSESDQVMRFVYCGLHSFTIEHINHTFIFTFQCRLWIWDLEVTVDM